MSVRWMFEHLRAQEIGLELHEKPLLPSCVVSGRGRRIWGMEFVGIALRLLAPRPLSLSLPTTREASTGRLHVA
jgi:hypothetical protein